jgi:hypothetical protein
MRQRAAAFGYIGWPVWQPPDPTRATRLQNPSGAQYSPTHGFANDNAREGRGLASPDAGESHRAVQGLPKNLEMHDSTNNLISRTTIIKY